MADAVEVTRRLLVGDAALIAKAPAQRITAGDIPQETALPAVGIDHISTARPPPLKLATSRVQVTVQAASYPSLREMQKLVRAALPHRPGTVNGIHVDTIKPGDEGPDDSDPKAGIYRRSQDFIVICPE